MCKHEIVFPISKEKERCEACKKLVEKQTGLHFSGGGRKAGLQRNNKKHGRRNNVWQPTQ